jgi:hypothetical protein
MVVVGESMWGRAVSELEINANGACPLPFFAPQPKSENLPSREHVIQAWIIFVPEVCLLEV